jgi:hypothetical protein
MKHSVEDYYNIIDKEIEWSASKSNQIVNNVTQEQAEWFVKGLEQAKLLIQKMQLIS